MAKNKQVRRPDVPPDDHVARHCNSQRIVFDPVTGVASGVFPQAFELRVQLGEAYLSTHWMEQFSVNVDAQFVGVVAALRNKRNVSSGSGVARLSAGLIYEAAASRNLPVRIRDRSSADDPGYSGIYGMPLDNSDGDFLGLLANSCCLEVRIVRDIDQS